MTHTQHHLIAGATAAATTTTFSVVQCSKPMPITDLLLYTIPVSQYGAVMQRVADKDHQSCNQPSMMEYIFAALAKSCCSQIDYAFRSSHSIHLLVIFCSKQCHDELVVE